MSDIMTETAISRVLITPEAEALVSRLRSVHGDLLFHQSGGCLRRKRADVLPAW